MSFKKANIPHQSLDYRPTHITYRLEGSLPKKILEIISQQRKVALEGLDLKLLATPKHLHTALIAAETFRINGNFELEVEDALHKIRQGPMHLERRELQKEVINSWLYLQESGEIYVYAICVMGNHVHALVRAPDGIDEVDISSLMNRHKAHTARVCNKLIGRTGLRFWEHAYFDRTVRDGKFERVVWYVLNNPVKAGLVKNWQDWSGSYLNPDYRLLFG